MLNNEKKILEGLVYQYGTIGIIMRLSDVIADMADKESDLGLKEKAVSSMKISDELLKLYEILKKPG